MINPIQNIEVNLFDKMAHISLFLALIAYGLIAGFFYAYSVDVMPALDNLPPLEAIHAMQEINTAVRNPVFFTTFFGPLIIGFFTFVLFVLAKNKKAAVFILLATLTYLLAAFFPTVSINVPMNIELGLLNPSDNDVSAMEIWRNYSEKWTFWNTARTVGSTLALVFVGLCFSAQKSSRIL